MIDFIFLRYGSVSKENVPFSLLSLLFLVVDPDLGSVGQENVPKKLKGYFHIFVGLPRPLKAMFDIKKRRSNKTAVDSQGEVLYKKNQNAIVKRRMI